MFNTTLLLADFMHFMCYDIERETRNMFIRTSILLRRFGKCSVDVKLSLFRSYCLCFYDIGMWSKYSSTVFRRMEACYNKCIKSYFKIEGLIV